MKVKVEVSPIEIELEPSEQTLADVIVVGYGTQRKSNVTGAVSSLAFDKEINSRPVVELGQALTGKLPGVQVLATNGRPGASSTIQIRGISSISAGSTPLIVIDGIPTPYYDLNLINPNDIASIDILKDAASAAIYGSRASNGVVLISTKSAKGNAIHFDVNFLTGIQDVISKIPVMDSKEYAEASIEAAQNGWVKSGGDPSAPNTIEARKNYLYMWPDALEHPENLPNTDFQDAIFRTAPINKINVSLRTGSEKSAFLLSGGYVNQKGIVLTSKYQKYNLSLKNVTHITNWLDVGTFNSISYDHEREPYYRTVEWAVQYPSIYPLYSSNGYLGSPNNQAGFEKFNAILFRPQNGHPLYRINDDIQHRRLNALGNIYADIHILPGLNFKTALNYYINRTDNTNYQSVDHQLGPAYYTQGIMTVDQTRILNYTYQNLLTYEKTFGLHNLSVVAGTEYNYNNLYFSLAERTGYDNDLIHSLAAGKQVSNAYDSTTQSRLISYLSRVNYNYDGRYLISLSIRRDGSSRFAPDHKWGYFPAASVGWNIHNEHFLQDLALLSTLKLRASYGLTGNDKFSDYRWIGIISQGHAALGNNLLTTYYPSSITNPDLQWERTKQVNLGLDFGLFADRILFIADLYRSVSDGLLLNVPVPIISGFSTVFQNIGKIENKGVELSLNTRNIVGEFTWNTAISFSFNRNKVLSLGVNDAPMIFNASVASGMQKINIVGQPVFQFYGYQYAGVYKNQAEIDADPAHYATATPGDGRYSDVNKDGVLDVNDRTAIGNPNPDFIWGITNNLSYKNIDLSFLLQGQQGGVVMDENIHRQLLYHEGRNYAEEVVNRWRSEDNPGDGYHYKLSTVVDGYEKTPSSYWLRSASYFRLKSLTIGYNFPDALLSKWKISSARIFLNGINLFTNKKSKVYDPENYSGDPTSTLMRGVVSSPYPTARIFSFGLNIGL